MRQIGYLLQKDFRLANKEDMEKVMATIYSMNYKPATIWTKVKCIRTFWRYINDLTSSDSVPAVIKWIETPSTPNEIQKEDLLTEKEVAKMLRASPDSWVCY